MPCLKLAFCIPFINFFFKVQQHKTFLVVCLVAKPSGRFALFDHPPQQIDHRNLQSTHSFPAWSTPPPFLAPLWERVLKLKYIGTIQYYRNSTVCCTNHNRTAWWWNFGFEGDTKEGGLGIF